MAIDTAKRRRSAICPGLHALRAPPFPSGSVEVEDRYLMAGMYAGLISQAPAQIAALPNISAKFDSGTHQYDLSVYFSGATTFAISPAVEAGWSFNTSTGVLTIDTNDENTFGPYTVTATNGNGDTDGNTFTVKVSTSSLPLPLLGPRGRLRIGMQHGYRK